MARVTFKEVEQAIRLSGWFPFGRREFECPGLGREEVEFYMKNNSLPTPCDRCYKALVFWDGNYTQQNVEHLLNMLNSFKIQYMGKLNENVVVFYFRDKREMLGFVENLEKEMLEQEIKGRTQWRRACKAYQEIKPSLWRNAKEFIPDTGTKHLCLRPKIDRVVERRTCHK